MDSMQVEDHVNWLIPPIKASADITPAYVPPWPDPYSDMLDMSTLDPSFTASLEDTIVDPNLIGGFEDVKEEAGADTNSTQPPAAAAIKEEISPDTSPDLDLFSQPSSGKRSSSLITTDSLPPSLPTPPPPQPRKRGRPQKRQQQVPVAVAVAEQQTSPTKRKRRSPQKRSPAETPILQGNPSSSTDGSLASVSVSNGGPFLKDRLSESPSGPGPTQSRRSRIREKNRIAACKCRRKQRKAVSNLTSTHEGLEDLNRQLCGQVSELEAEAYALKNMLMEHGNCGCEMIQQYFKDAAASLVQKADVDVGGPSAASGSAAGVAANE